MALTKTERKLLIAARKRIATGRNSFICFALAQAAAAPAMRRACGRLRKYIHKQLGRHTSLRHWQLAHGIDRTRDQLRTDRLAWIDWMLDQ